MATDHQLLRRYADEGSAEAFGELAEHHADSVYSACCRALGGSEDAEDATQAVFIALAQKAGSIGASTPIAAWLHTAARYACRKILRGRARRKAHEREAAAMRSASAQPPDDGWDEVSPELDEAVESLPRKYREVVVLRHFSGLSEAETATQLGRPVGTVKGQLSRAVEKLRGRLAARGVTVGGAALTGMLGGVIIEAAPARLAATVTAAATGTAAASGTALGLAKGITNMMMWAKVKFVAACMAGAVAVGGVTAPVAMRALAEDGGAPGELASGGPRGTAPQARPPIVADADLKVVKISKPGPLTGSNTLYVLTQDVTADGTAFSFGRGVTGSILDLGGHTVTYNNAPKKAGKNHEHNIHGISISTKKIAVRNGIILQGKGASPGCHAIRMSGAGSVEIYNTITRVHGDSCSNIYSIWGGTDGSIHDNYMDNRSRGIVKGLFAPACVAFSQTRSGWHIYGNTMVGGHRSVQVSANAIPDRNTRAEIHHNMLAPRRIHGIKAPQGFMCFGSASNHFYENEISSDDSRGINLQGQKGGNHYVHNNMISCRYSTVAKAGNYVENRCYGYWERDNKGNRIIDNVFIVGNETKGDGSSNSLGILATTTGIRLPSAEYRDNLIIVRHSDPGCEVTGFEIKRSDAGVKAVGNEVLARTAAFKVFADSKGVTLKDNRCIKPKGSGGWQAITGDSAPKAVTEGNKTVEMPPAATPSAPKGLIAASRLEAVELRWRRVRGEYVVGYNVYRDGKKINTWPSGGRFHVDLTAKSGASYSYAVSAVDLSGREGPRSKALKMTVGKPMLGSMTEGPVAVKR